MPVLTGSLLASAALSALAAAAWLFRGPRLRNVILALSYFSLTLFLGVLGLKLRGDLGQSDVRLLVRLAIPMSGAGLAAGMTFLRGEPWRQLAARRQAWALWFLGAVASAYATTRPDFLGVWTGSSGTPVLIFNAPATWTLVGFLAVLVSISVYLESTFRAAGPGERKRMGPVFLGLFVGLGALLVGLTLSLLFSTFYVPAWMAAALPLGLAAVLGGLAALDPNVAGLEVPVDRTTTTTSASVFVAGIYVLLLGLAGEISRLTGLRLSTVAFLGLACLLLLGLVIFYVSNRAHKRVQGFVDRNFLLSHRDYRQQWMQANSRLSPDRRLQGLLGAASELLQDCFSVREVSIFLRRRGSEALDLVYSLMPGPGLSVLPGEPLVRHLVHTRRPLLLGRRSDDFECVPIWVENHHILNRTGARVWAPLFCGEDLVGMVGLGAKLNDLRFTYEDLDYLDTLSSQLAVALWGARLAENWALEREQDCVRRLSSLVVRQLDGVQMELEAVRDRLAAAQDGLAAADGPPGAGDALDAMCERLALHIQAWGALRAEPAASPQLCTVEDVVREAVNGFSLNGARERVTLIVDLPPGLPRVSADPSGLSGVVMRLLHNAVEAMPDGGSLKIGARPADRGPSRGEAPAVIVTVSDEGSGMTRDFQERHLFRPFCSTKSDGLGLGLFYSKCVVEAHGGSLRAVSEAGKGTTFELELPAARAAGLNAGDPLPTGKLP